MKKRYYILYCLDCHKLHEVPYTLGKQLIICPQCRTKNGVILREETK